MFPYLAPVKDWTVEVFNDREANPIDDNLLMPWMILTSGAKVLKTKVASDSKTAAADYESLIKNSNSIEQYSGCIIKNNTTPEDPEHINKAKVKVALWERDTKKGDPYVYIQLEAVPTETSDAPPPVSAPPSSEEPDDDLPF